RVGPQLAPQRIDAARLVVEDQEAARGQRVDAVDAAAHQHRVAPVGRAQLERRQVVLAAESEGALELARYAAAAVLLYQPRELVVHLAAAQFPQRGVARVARLRELVHGGVGFLAERGQLSVAQGTAAQRESA